MKKIFALAAMAIAVGTMVSCNGNNPKASLKTDVDTLSYAIGVVQTNGLTDYLVQAKGVDTTYMAQFIEGLLEGANSADDKGKAAYLVGIEMGRQIGDGAVKNINYQLFGADSTKTISARNLMAGLINALTKNDQKMSMEEADSIANTLFERIKNKTMEEKYGDVKAASEAFLQENAKNDSVKTVPVTVTLPNGSTLDSYFQYKVLKEANGIIPTDSNQAIVNYAGRLIDGTEFDNSYKRNQPLTVNMKGGVIPGCIEVLKRMPAGSIWEVYIPQELAYGSREMGNIPPFSTLIFKMELLEVK